MMADSRDDGNFLVRVRAQVMTRDDSTGGWVPMGPGGISLVSVCKGSVSGEDGKVEYLIFGKRIEDQTVVLSCTIKKDLQYNEVMPTFRHWHTGDKKFGLTFQTSADARQFDRGVKKAIEELSDGNGDFPNFHESDFGDDEVFMQLDLPMCSRSSSGSSTFSGHSYPQQQPGVMPQETSPHQHRMAFVRSPRFHNRPAAASPANNNVRGYVADPTAHIWHHKDITADPNSYVQLSKGRSDPPHDYSYPIVDGLKRGEVSMKPEGGGVQMPPAPRLPTKAKRKTRKGVGSGRQQCRHCLEVYSEDENGRGSCEDAPPDRVLRCMGAVSCVPCAQGVLYHCTADSEGDFEPCTCDGRWRKRWTALALLSLVLPCLWCYLPFRACHQCGKRCGLCGGRHEPA